MDNIIKGRLKEVEKIHDEAMDLLGESFIALMKKDVDLSRKLKLQAYHKEKDAAYRLINEDIEPSRSILFRSAASLAYELGLHEESKNLVCIGLNGNPPDRVVGELDDLYHKIIRDLPKTKEKS